MITESQNFLEVLIPRISQYSGRQAINRFCFLAEHTNQTGSLLAYKNAIERIMRDTWDVQIYKNVLNSYNEAIVTQNNNKNNNNNNDNDNKSSQKKVQNNQSFSSSSKVKSDEGWIEEVQVKVNQTSKKLENDLKIHTSNLVKDSIRIACNELAIHSRRIGDQISAQKLYTKSREYISPSNPISLVENYWSMIDLAFDTGNYSLAINQVGKIEGALEAVHGSSNQNSKSSKSKNVPGLNNQGTSGFRNQSNLDPAEKDFQCWNERILIVTGLCALSQGNYLRAANSFVKVSREAGQSPNMETLAIPADIAVYATLCALASFDRRQLKEKILDEPEFRSLLETEPNYRNIISSFRENKYRDVFKLLRSSLPAYRADLYLSNQIDRLIPLIEERAIVQYFTPFSSASLTKASEVFGWSLETLQMRIIRSIKEKTLEGRIDLSKNVLNKRLPGDGSDGGGLVVGEGGESRRRVFKNSIENSIRIDREFKLAVLRMNLIYSDLIVKEPKNNNRNKNFNCNSNSNENDNFVGGFTCNSNSSSSGGGGGNNMLNSPHSPSNVNSSFSNSGSMKELID